MHSALAASAGTTELQVESILQAIIREATTALLRYGRFRIPAFVSLKVKKIPAGPERTKKIGDKMVLCKARPDRKKVSATALKPFKATVDA